MEILLLLSLKCWDDTYTLACLADSSHFYLWFRTLLCATDLRNPIAYLTPPLPPGISVPKTDISSLPWPLFQYKAQTIFWFFVFSKQYHSSLSYQIQKPKGPKPTLFHLHTQSTN